MGSFRITGARLVTAGAVLRAPLFLDGGRIVDALPAGAETIDLAGHLVFPGLLNAHDHLPLNSIPRPEGIPLHTNSYSWIEAFQPWLDDPRCRSARAVPERVRAWHGGLKNVLAGTTTIAHHDPWCAAFDEPAFPVSVLERFGWAHSLGLSDRYGPGVKPSHEATPRDTPWFIHLAEGIDDVAKRELESLEALGALGHNSVLVHGTGLSPGDVERVVAREASVVWCPTSNLFMFGKTLHPRRLFDAGRLALGTDSRLTGSFDLLHELKAAARESDLTPAELLRLVTVFAARVLRRPDVGGLAPSQRADLVVIPDPGGDPYSALLATDRAGLAAVVREGTPAVAEPHLARLFELAGITPRSARLDGRPKLVGPALLSVRESVDLEQGLVPS